MLEILTMYNVLEIQEHFIVHCIFMNDSKTKYQQSNCGLSYQSICKGPSFDKSNRSTCLFILKLNILHCPIPKIWHITVCLSDLVDNVGKFPYTAELFNLNFEAFYFNIRFINKSLWTWFIIEKILKRNKIFFNKWFILQHIVNSK